MGKIKNILAVVGIGTLGLAAVASAGLLVVDVHRPSSISSSETSSLEDSESSIVLPEALDVIYTDNTSRVATDFNEKPSNVSGSTYGAFDAASFNFLVGDGDRDLTVSSNSGRMNSTIIYDQETSEAINSVYSLRIGWTSAAPANNITSFGQGYSKVAYLIFNFTLVNSGNIVPSETHDAWSGTGSASFYVRTSTFDWIPYEEVAFVNGEKYQFAFVYATNSLSNYISLNGISFALTQVNE